MQSPSCGGVFIARGYSEIILPSLWEQEPFVDKAGSEVLGQMYSFRDKAGRQICLIPECTAIIQSLYKQTWIKSQPRPMRIFYVSRCYRYERPQKGRYREFWQFGAEHLGGNPPEDRDETISILRECLDDLGIKYEIQDGVKRGLDYYTEDGFEAVCESLGAQKQIAGGGRYDIGVGFAIGIERALLAKE